MSQQCMFKKKSIFISIASTSYINLLFTMRVKILDTIIETASTNTIYVYNRWQIYIQILIIVN